MRSLTFALDTQTGSDEIAPATLTISEAVDGSLSFTVTNVGDGDNQIGDLRGVFFDVADDSLLGTFATSGADITDFDQSGAITNLGNGATVSGVPDAPFEVGIEFGTPGISGDDIQTTTFSLSSTSRALTLDDLALESIAVRQTSVGDADGSRDGSDKLYGAAPYPVNAIDDAVSVLEDEIATGNVFANDIDEDAGDANNDGIPDGLTVTAIGGDQSLVGQSSEIADGVTLVINADGSYGVDANEADYLSVGELIEHTVDYTVDDGNGGTDTATVTITVEGVNDDPIANPEANATDEATTVSGNVLDNDSDIDRLDSIAVSAINGDEGAVGTEVTLESGALVTLNADGTYSYDPNGAFDALNTGDQAMDSFTYSISDGNGGTATTTVEITIDGIGEPVEPPVDEDHFGTFLNKKGTAEHAISNVVFYVEGEDGDITKVKVDGWDSGESDLDNVDYFAFIDSEYADSELVAVSIKAGNNHNKDLGPGEGQLFLLDGDEDIDYVQGGVAPEPLTIDILGAKADVTYDYSDGLFIG
jgi:VCBS repeat-containing protein